MPRTNASADIRRLTRGGRLWLVVSGAAVLVWSVSGCTAIRGEDSAAAETSVSFATAVAAGEGAAACDLLAEHTRAVLEDESGADCADALIALDLPAQTEAGSVRAYGRGAQTTYDSDAYFLVLEPDGWRVTAAGCTPRADLPYDCELKGE